MDLSVNAENSLLEFHAFELNPIGICLEVSQIDFEPLKIFTCKSEQHGCESNFALHWPHEARGAKQHVDAEGVEQRSELAAVFVDLLLSEAEGRIAADVQGLELLASDFDLVCRVDVALVGGAAGTIDAATASGSRRMQANRNLRSQFRTMAVKSRNASIQKSMNN